ncbi:MAG: alpha/beta hydrolase [Lachnospiraceae bacterium]|nr:alpha/beta hydrolase [Lachnospiraceae bacterium]
MEKVKSVMKKLLCISIVLMLVGSIGAAAFMTDFGKIRVIPTEWVTSAGHKITGTIYQPKKIKEGAQLPAVLCCHGMFNNKEMQASNYVELARRGYVVLNIDMLSHGSSENVSGIEGCLMTVNEALPYLASLSYVDKDRIGITGHSLGAWNCNMAAIMAAMSGQRLYSAILLHCKDPEYLDQAGENYVDLYQDVSVGVVAAQYDEFFMTMTDENGNLTSPTEYVSSANAQSFLNFGKDISQCEKRTDGVKYHETINGKDVIRTIYSMNLTHAWEPFKMRASAATVNYFNEVFGVDTKLDDNNQIWIWKEIFQGIGLIGFWLFVLSFASTLLFTKPFESLTVSEEVAPYPFEKVNKGWFWGGTIVTVLYGGLSFVPVMNLMNAFTHQREFWAQSNTAGVGVWVLSIGVVMLLCSFLAIKFGTKAEDGLNLKEMGVATNAKTIGKSILFAIVVTAASYGCVFLSNYLFKVDYRFGLFCVKVFQADKLLLLFPYVLFFIVFFVINSIMLNTLNYNDMGKKKWVNIVVMMIVAIIPISIVMLLQYGKFFTTGFMRWTDPGSMYIVGLYPMFVILPMATLISRKLYKLTKNPYVGALVVAILCTLMSVANNLTWK